jgi:hypothetical protein
MEAQATRLGEEKSSQVVDMNGSCTFESSRSVSTILVSESKSQEGCSVHKEERGLRGSGELEPEGDNDRFSRREATLLPVSTAETVEPDICRIE